MSRLPFRLAAGGALLLVAALGVVLWLSQAGAGEQEVEGVLVDVQSRDIVNAERVTLRDAEGALRAFRVSPEVAANPDHPNSASHLRQHLAAADPVIVRFKMTPDGPVAIRILDAGRIP